MEGGDDKPQSEGQPEYMTLTASNLPKYVDSGPARQEDVLSDIASSANGQDSLLLPRMNALRIDTGLANNGNANTETIDEHVNDDDDDDDASATAPVEDTTIPQSQGSPMSKSSRAANRLLKNRRDRRNRNSVGGASVGSSSSIEDNDDASVASESTEKSPVKGRSPWKPPLPTSPTKSEFTNASFHTAQTGGSIVTGMSAAAQDNVSTTGSQSGATPNALKSLRRLRAGRQRTPGGAAAKLVGRALSNVSASENDTDGENGQDDEPPQVEARMSELDALRQKAKDEFAVGQKSNRRYHQSETADEEKDHSDDRAISEASLPSILNRSEVFHQSATAAVLSLLNSRNGKPGGSTLDMRSIRTPQTGSVASAATKNAGGASPTNSQATDQQSPAHSAFQPPKRSDDEDMYSVRSAMSSGRRVIHPRHNEHQSARDPIEKPLISITTEQRVEAMEKKMQDPSKTLADLLSAIASPQDGALTRGYMVRRKNACGALQVLVAKPHNRKAICWTVGVLPALTSVLNDDLHVPHSDKATRNEYVEARNRAITSLLNLSTPTENRLPFFHSPGLVPALVETIENDDQEACRGSCAVLAYLSKTAENRLLMVQVPGLIDAITGVIEPPKRDIVVVSETVGKRKLYVNEALSVNTHSEWSENGGDDEESGDEEEREESIGDEEEEEEEEDGADASTNLSSDSDDDEEGETGNESNSLSSNDDDESKTSDSDTDPRLPSMIQADMQESIGDLVRRYDNDPNMFLHAARQNVFALLGHLVKEKDNAYHLTRHLCLIEALVQIARLHGSPSHIFAVRIFAHLTRHRANSKELVFNLKKVVPVLVNGTYSSSEESRKYACFALQNLTQDKPCRQELAIIPNLLTALCVRARQAVDPEERLASIHALKNLTDEPANLIPMTNTPECFATLMQIAHASDDSITEMMQYLGCDALATLSHWFRSIATSGQRIEAMKAKKAPSKDLFVPSLSIIAWEQWN